MRRRAPVRLAGAVHALAAQLEPLTPLAAIQREWADAVGGVVAAEAQPVAERAGVVTIRCSSAVWAQELTLLGPELVGRLNAALGDARVTELRCSTAGRRGPV
jgi:predicted nucleic acid-binding Zn ribbon protein